jgi:hypothetical protein
LRWVFICMPHTYISSEPSIAPPLLALRRVRIRSERSPMAGGRLLQSAVAIRLHQLASRRRTRSSRRSRELVKLSPGCSGLSALRRRSGSRRLLRGQQVLDLGRTAPHRKPSSAGGIGPRSRGSGFDACGLTRSAGAGAWTASRRCGSGAAATRRGSPASLPLRSGILRKRRPTWVDPRRRATG